MKENRRMNRNEEMMRVERRNERNGEIIRKGQELSERLWSGIDKAMRES